MSSALVAFAAKLFPAPFVAVVGVRNQPDRFIEAVASGRGDAVGPLITARHEGPPATQLAEATMSEGAAPEEPLLRITA